MPTDAKTFKEALSRFASGVTIVTTMGEQGPHGLTVSAFCSVSADPPRVLICLGNATNTKPLIEGSGSFAVHILGREGVNLAPRFANMLPDVDDPFDGLEYDTAATGSPILRDCLAWLDCSVSSMVASGDHTIFVGTVEAVQYRDITGEPVLYYQRAFRVLHPEAIDP